MIHIAIMGFGTVGGGVAELITNNSRNIADLGSDQVYIKYILDIKEFPDSPFADRIIYDFDTILYDESISTVIEVIGGSHPVYEYTIALLSAGKNVITSNKEAVAKYGAEFLDVARKNGVVYRFEASVGGGIPVISPLISFIKHNKIREVRGILNGTTNYILEKMFTYGESFESALHEAQARGYAERNPDSDVLGLDACRKIAILSALVTGYMVPTERIYTEGITKIRSLDVKGAAALGYTVKLLGRCIMSDEDEKNGFIMVSPFLLPETSSLSAVSGVYNAIEIIGEPVGNIMFYGKGAGAGATASAVVGDLMLILREGTSYAVPAFYPAGDDMPIAFERFASRHYLAFPQKDKASVEALFGKNRAILLESEFAFLTESMSESEIAERLLKLSERGVFHTSHLRIL